jgi:hypothetical protein
VGDPGEGANAVRAIVLAGGDQPRLRLAESIADKQLGEMVLLDRHGS